MGNEGDSRLSQAFSFRIPQAIEFGPGVHHRLPALLRARSTERVLLITDPGLVAAGVATTIESTLTAAGSEVVLFQDVPPEPHLDDVERCRAFAAAQHASLVVGVGGGSVLDCAKIVGGFASSTQPLADFLDREDESLAPGLPIYLLPTTAGSGAEATTGAIVTVNGRKCRLAGSYVHPVVAIIDPTFTRSLPASITIAGGLDALTHAIESYAARRASPMSRLYSREAFRLILTSLPRVLEDGDDMEARSDMSLAALYAGIAVANAGAGAVHALAYPLGGRTNIPHGIANAILLPHVLRQNVATNPESYVALCTEQDSRSAGAQCDALLDAVQGLLHSLKTPTHLAEIGMQDATLPALAKEAHTIRRLLDNNVRDYSPAEILAIYEAAW
ncbi:MAG: iron-containing alcohol dehydrogenase [Chloroflexi bacterium]|nr:iron-containing alcohol dehydrogenase [Chloroflexota bacterium]